MPPKKNIKKESKELTFNDFSGELKLLLQKYGYKHVIFAADEDTREGNMFHGALNIESEKCSLNDILLAFGNVSRMYQSMREKLLKII
jgi:hypothetical protein